MRGCGGGGGRSAAGRALNRRGGFHIRPRVFAPLQFPGPPPRFPRLRRAGVHARRTTAISKSERPRRRGVRRDGGIPPYGRPGGGGHPGWSKAQNLFVGAGFTAPAGAFRRPTAAQRRLLGRRSRPRNPAPPRGSRDDASIVPYTGLQRRRVVVSRLAVRRAAGRRGGFHIRPRAPAPLRGSRFTAAFSPAP